VLWLGVSALSASAQGEALVASGAACRYQVPTSGADGTNWTTVAFDDALWLEGASGLGYDTQTTYASLFGATVPVGTVGFYARFAFTVPAGTRYDSLTLRLKYEDGFIAYLNGTEVARSNAPASAVHNSVSTADRADSLAVVFQDYNLTAVLSLLREGTNVLAVHALNNSGGSTDLLMLPELTAEKPGAVTNLVINEFMALNDSTRKNSLGKYEDWVELYNPTPTNVNLSGWYLTDKASSLTKWQFPSHAASVIPSKGYLLVWADSKSYSVTNNELHTSFSLSGDGEYLGLVLPDGATVAHAYAPVFPPQYDDVSYGLGETGESRFFALPTPGAVNAFSGGSNQVAGVKFSPKRGVYTNAMPQVTVSVSMEGSEIRYTTDAEVPTAASTLYTAPLDLTQTAVFRAAAFKSGFAPSEIDTHSYISADAALRQTGIPAGYPTNAWISGASTNVPDYSMNQAVVAAYGAELTNALKALPSLSLVTTVSNLFDAATGIYTHPSGNTWERETSAEWIDADNDSRFQTGCGLQIQGGAFRGFNLSMKKSFALQFRSIYGEGRLEEKLFSGGTASSYDDLVLRAGANDAWNKWGHQKTQYIVDEFMRQTHRDMGGWSPHGRFVHLYLNGLYWGIYNVTEKVSSELVSLVYGGRDDTWDVRSQDTALDGTFAAWNAMVNLLPTNGVSNDTYQQVQGNNPSGTRNPAYPVYLDVGNYIDYLVANYWSANSDWPWNNWRAFRDRNDAISTGFKFSVWDAEAGMGVWGDINSDVTGEARGAAVMHSRLALNAEYRLRFADRIQKHMFNNGVLTPGVTVPLYQELAATIEPALVAESARWGDQDGNATHTVDQWRTQRDYVLNTFLTQRGAKALQFFRTRGLYPTNDAPAFAQFGGSFSNSLNLVVTAAQPVYYTTDGSDPRQYGTGAVAGVLYTNGVALSRAARVKARARTPGGEWSALTEAVFTPVEKPALRVTELMYHPRTPGAFEDEGYLDGDDEFIELQNAGSAPVGLAGLRFTQGVAFDFTEGAVQSLNPGEYVLVVKNIAAFTNRYPSVPPQRIAGVFAFPSTSLNDAGETVVIEDALGRKVVSFTYNDRWLVATDGAGHSLVPLPGVAQTDEELDYAGNWKASVYIGGSPGQAEPSAPSPSLVLNEILAHTDTASPPYDSNDGIELYNTTAEPVLLGAGWYLSDDPEDLTKWAVPATNSLAAFGWRYFDEIHDFHSPITNGFGLNKASEQVLLSYLPGTGLDRVVDAVSFKGEENGVPLVRFPDGAASWYYGVPTPGASNRLADASVLISEVMYHPKPTADHPENNENDEYVELHNPTGQPITLMNLAADVGVWRLAGGISYLFPESTVLPAGGRLVVVPFDPVSDAEALGAFLSAYALTNGQIRLFGPYSGQLNNKTDTVRLERPVNPDVAGEDGSWHVVDQVTYYDAAPWVAEADGTGCPLVRLPGQNSGTAPSSWVAGLDATPGLEASKIVVSAPSANTSYLVPRSISVEALVDAAFVVGTVRQVVFCVDGVEAASVSAAPYAATVALDARQGVRLITARLTDDEGDATSSAVPVVAYTNMPSFESGMDREINLTVTDRIDLHAAVGSLSGFTNPVSFVWSCPGDSSVVLDRPTQTDASARFAQPGEYELMLTLYYGQLLTNRFITVTVTETNTVNRIPYKEAFEAYELGSTLIGIGGWYGAYAELAVVETNRYDSGLGGIPLQTTHERGLSFSGSISNRFVHASTLTNICVDMLVGFEPGIGDWPDEEPDAQLAFWVSEDRRLLVWHGQPGSSNRWAVLPDVMIPSNAFTRLTVQADYACDLAGSFKFRIWADRVPVTRPSVWYATANTNRNYLSSVDFKGMGQVDDLVVDSYNSMLYRRITASAGPHGSVVPAGELLVPVGSSTNIAVLPDPFYQVNTVLADGQGVGPVLNFAFTNVWDEHTLSADFLAKLTASGVPELWLNRLNPAWTDNFAAHAQEDTDGDGVANGQEYVAGTDASNSQSVFRLDLRLSNGLSVVSFPTVPYSGEDFGLSGLRRYALEQVENLKMGEWRGVAGLTNVMGAGQSVVHTNGFDVPLRFFRGRVWLEP
jgi:hypothetical protein